jgi:putative ATPase
MTAIPLSEALRPQKLEEFVGQLHIVGENGILRKLIKAGLESGRIPSLIFWGPPGTGKTTLARLVAKELNTTFHEFSAVNASAKDIENVIPKKINRPNQLIMDENPFTSSNTPIIFIDEIHRFNKAQQDKLLPHVERGNIVFIGATTENPSFEIISPLLSRTRVLVLNQHTEDNLEDILEKALKHLNKKLKKDAKEFLIGSSNGDARVLLNVLEIASSLTSQNNINLEDIEQALQRRQLSFDLKGEEYYNTISALHKSLRGSDPDAALYYLARMLEAGQDPLYIARRMIRAAAEDIGLADPQALVIANAAFEACDKIGMPECNVILAECVAYFAKAPKSNSLYVGYNEAKEDVHKYGNLPVPLHIRNAPTKLMKEVGYGKGYDYSHSSTGKKKEEIEYLPEKLKGKKYLKSSHSQEK